MTFQKRKRNPVDKDPRKKRKKPKRSNVDIKEETPKAEMLDIQTVREGMLLLGCVIEIRSNCVLVSLPGCLVGAIPLNNISIPYTKVLQDRDENDVTLKHLFDLGALYPCKVLKVTRYEFKKPTIILSIDPQTVNSNLGKISLYNKMVLYAAVVSIEDHGYIMDLGVKGTRGFLPFNAAISENLLNIGQVIPTSINSAPTQNEVESVVTLTALSFENAFPEISVDNVKLSAILPGACVSADICQVTPQFLYMKCLEYDACSSAISLFNKQKKLTEGVTVTGRVLYVHPITHLIYIHLGSYPTPATFNSFFNLQKYDKIKNLKFFDSQHHKLYFQYQNVMGYVKRGDVEGKTTLTYDSLIQNPLIPKARVVFLHFMDNLVQLTFKQSQLEMKVVKAEDVQIGDIYEATVFKHVEDGMFVRICPNLSGFVRHVLFSDSYVTMPEKLHPEGATVKCRVLAKHPTLGLSLTCKESLINTPVEELLKSYEEAIIGNTYKGVIVKKTDDYCVVLFCNNIQGIISSEDISEGSLFYVGQTVSCVVLSCNPEKNKLKLSLNCDKPSLKQSKNLKTKLVSSEVPSPEYVIGKAYKAFIKQINAHQLNILVNGVWKGRVHITQTGCTEEGVFPLSQFKVGQRIKVYVLQEYEVHRRNFLPISHRSKRTRLECSLLSPTPSSLALLNGSVELNKHVLGFVKKMYDGFAAVWLSPYKSGVLDYVDVSKCPKELRKMTKKYLNHLKLSQSLTVSPFLITQSFKREEEQIKVTTPDISVPEVGKIVVGFITVASVDRDLVLKLPYNYTGYVCLTDLQDIFIPLQKVLHRLLKFKFVQGYVLETNHDTRTCILTLRKSRVDGQKYKTGIMSPEVTLDTLEQGKKVNGFITAIYNSHVLVRFGRKITGKVLLHKCKKYGCVKCQKVSEILKSAELGNVIEVVIDDTSPVDGFIQLSIPGVLFMDTTENTSLQVKEDIDWNDLQ